MKHYTKKKGPHIALIYDGSFKVYDCSASASLDHALRHGYLTHPNGTRYYLKPRQKEWLVTQSKENKQ